MTAYQGGKKRLGKKIANILKEHSTLDYFEPFCGMCGVIHHMNDGNRKILANDLNTDLILLLKAVQKGWSPEDKYLSREEYNEMRVQKPSKERGFYGIACGYNNEYMGFYRPWNNKQDYVGIGIRNLKKLNIKNVEFTNKSYLDFKPDGLLIYCDPPYKNNSFKANKYFNDFDHELFWNTMREWSKNNIVYISEYNAPKDFECIFEQKTNYNFNIINKSENNIESYQNDKIEKIYKYKEY